MSRQRPMPRPTHDVVNVAVQVHVDRVGAAGGQRAPHHHRRDEPDRWDPPLGKHHGRHGGDQQQLDDAWLGERHVGAKGVGSRWRLDVARGGRRAEGRSRRPAPHAQPQPEEDGPQRRSDREMGNHEERGEPGPDVGRSQRHLEHDQYHGDRRQPARQGCVQLVADTPGGPGHQQQHAQRQDSMGELHGLAHGRHHRQQAAVHEQEVRIGQARAGAGHPRTEQHLGQDYERRDADERCRARRSPARQRPVGRSIRDQDGQRQHGERHGEVRRDQLGTQLLDHHLTAEHGLHHHQHPCHHGRDEHRAIAATRAHHGDQCDPADQRPHGERGDQAVGVLDPGIEVRGWDPRAEAERPIRAAEP